MPNSNVEPFPGFDDKPLTKEDFKAVRELIGEVVRDEHALTMAKSIVAWLTAFGLFKKLERNIGLPMSPDSKLVYGGIVAQLKGAGKWILIASGNNIGFGKEVLRNAKSLVAAGEPVHQRIGLH